MFEFWVWFAVVAVFVWFALVILLALLGGFFVIWGIARTVRWGTSTSGRWRR